MTAHRFTLADFTDERLHAFLIAHVADMAGTAPPESQHALDLSGLDQPYVRLWVGHDADVLVATGAWVDLGAGQAELKSMRTSPEVRGEGWGRAMVRHLLDDARAAGMTRISLETGAQPFFAAAHALYVSEGFVECAPFGDYVEDPHSVFMTRDL